MNAKTKDKLERMQRKSSKPIGRGERVRTLRPAKDGAPSERPARQPRDDSPRKGRSTVAERPSDVRRKPAGGPKRSGPGTGRGKPRSE